MSGEITNDAGDPGSVAATTVFFDIPVDLVSCTYKLQWSYNQFKERPDSIRSYLNDCVIEHTDNDYQYGVAVSIVQPDTLFAGRNSFKLRRTHSDYWWGSIRGLKLHVQNAPPRVEVGMVLFVR